MAPKRTPLISSKSAEYGTPPELADAARQALGGSIDLDPCSRASCNAVVRASRYYSLLERGENGLELPWYGGVYCNPPGELTGKRIRAFWQKAVAHANEGGRVVWAGFSLNQLTTLQTQMGAWPGSYPLVVLRKRVAWINPETGEPMKQPTHGCFFAGLNIEVEDFIGAFARFGKTLIDIELGFADAAGVG